MLIVLCRAPHVLEPKNQSADDLIALFVAANDQTPQERIDPFEHLEDLDYVQSGVLFYRKYAQ